MKNMLINTLGFIIASPFIIIGVSIWFIPYVFILYININLFFIIRLVNPKKDYNKKISILIKEYIEVFKGWSQTKIYWQELKNRNFQIKKIISIIIIMIVIISIAYIIYIAFQYYNLDSFFSTIFISLENFSIFLEENIFKFIFYIFSISIIILLIIAIISDLLIRYKKSKTKEAD